MRRADGYYAQFCVAIDRLEEVEPTEQVIALDVGLMHFSGAVKSVALAVEL